MLIKFCPKIFNFKKHFTLIAFFRENLTRQSVPHTQEIVIKLYKKTLREKQSSHGISGYALLNFNQISIKTNILELVENFSP